MAKGSGVRCGAAYISASKVCRISMAPEIQKALNAATGEIGAKSLKAAVQKHAGGKGVARLREIRNEIRQEMGGVIVKGPKADELKRRLQAEGLLPEGKAKSVAPKLSPLVLNWAPKEAARPEFTPLPKDIKDQLAALDGPTNRNLKKEYNKLVKEQDDLKVKLDALVKERDKKQPDALYGAWETGDLKKFRDGMEKRDPKKFEEAIKRVDGELARREKPSAPPVPSALKKELQNLAAKDPQVSDQKGRTTKENEDLSRILRGESPKYMDVVDDAGEAGAAVRMKSKSQIAKLQSVLGLGAQTRKDIGRDLEGLENEARDLQANLRAEIQAAKPGSRKRNQLINQLKKVEDALAAGQTNASASTKYAREWSKNFDGDLERKVISREGDTNFNGWGETVGKGSKKLGQGAFGTVSRTEDKTHATKRGDISATEARLIQRLGEADLGPRLIAADINGSGRQSNPGVDVRLGRIAMSIVPGSPIGSKAPDKTVGGVRVADAYWTARANLHRMGIAHNDMHIDNVLVDRKGKGRFVDMGLAQDLPKAALAEALGAFEKPRGAMVTRASGVQGQGDWQVRRWEGTAGRLLSAAQGNEPSRRELERRAPVAARVLSNKNTVQDAMRKDGFTNDDIASVMDHGLRNSPSTYNQGVWSRMTDKQAMRYINMLYEGV